MIAGLPLVFLLLAQQLCQTLVLERGGRLHLAVVPVHRVSSFWKRCTQRILILILFAPIPLGGESPEFLWLRFAPSRRAACRREWCGVTDRGAGRW